MSQYLKQKILRRIQEARENINVECDGIREAAVESGISHMISNIPNLNYKEVDAPKLEKPVHTPNYKHTDLAEVAIDIYKNNINPKEEVIKEAPQPVAPVKKHDMKAIARSLTGMRNGGDHGNISIAAGPNGGDAGTYSPEASENGGNSTNSASNYEALTTSMTLEEYEMYIRDSWGIVNEQQEVEEEPESLEYISETSAVDELETELLKLEDANWTSIDKVMRVIAKDHGITPKELHKEFKSSHGGQIPDDWIKEQAIQEECGWYPLEEAKIQKNGMVYEVSMIWKGSTHRLKFFWPEMKMPSRNEMVRASDMFYPGSRLLAYYPSEEESGNFMVLVPPLTEYFVVSQPQDWVTLSSEDQETYEMICEEVGEPIDIPQQMNDGSYQLVVEDHDTGENKVVSFGEGKKGLWDNIHAKRKRGESPAKKGDKDYPKTLNVEDLQQARKNVGASTCWDGYKAKGTKKKGGKSVPNCVKEDQVQEDMSGMSQKSGDKRSTESGAGMTSAGVKKYNSRTGGNLKTAVTTPPSELKAGSKAAGRRKSFCARSKSWNGERGKAARKRWNC